MMPRASRINPQLKIAAEILQLLWRHRLEFVHVERRRQIQLRLFCSCSGGSVGRFWWRPCHHFFFDLCCLRCCLVFVHSKNPPIISPVPSAHRVRRYSKLRGRLARSFPSAASARRSSLAPRFPPLPSAA